MTRKCLKFALLFLHDMHFRNLWIYSGKQYTKRSEYQNEANEMGRMEPLPKLTNESKCLNVKLT